LVDDTPEEKQRQEMERIKQLEKPVELIMSNIEDKDAKDEYESIKASLISIIPLRQKLKVRIHESYNKLKSTTYNEKRRSSLLNRN
jgi:hypothetical protein